MKMQWWRGLALIGLVALLLFPAVAPSAQAQGGPVVAEHYVLEAGEVVDGDLIVVAQTITITAGSRVAGDAALIGETILVQGQIDGRLTALGDNVTLGEGLQAAGSVTLCADSIVRQDNTAILGEFHANCDQLGTLFTETVPLIFDSSQWKWDELTLPDVDVRRVVAEVNPLGTPVERLAGNLGVALFMAGLAALVTLFVPLRLRRVSDAALAAPISTTVIGVTTFVASGALSGLVLLSLVLVITICLVPFMGLGWLALGLMLVLGLTALSLPLGAWVLGMLNVRPISPLAAAAVGAFIISFGSGLLSISLYTLLLYFIVLLGLASWGLGAVVMTRIGTQRYPNPTANAARQPISARDYPYTV